MTAETSPKRALLLGAFWAVAARWSIKAIGFVNTIVMARLLMPEDFGVVAMAMLAVGLVQAIIDFGAGIALLRKADVTRQEIDSAWSLGIVQGVVSALVVAALVPWATRYFEEPKVEVVLWALALGMLIQSPSNIGLILAQKQFQFAVFFRHQVTCKVIGVAATIGAGLLMRDYRALVIGMVAGQVASLALSYVMHPYRPRWDTSRISEIWGVSKWLMLSGIGTFIVRRSDELIAARIGTTREYGLYSVGADFGQLPAGEVGPALLRAFMPVLASLEHDRARANQAVLTTSVAVSSITFAIGIGFFAIAEPAVRLVLGSHWAQAAAIVQVFALVSTMQLIPSPLSTLLITRGYAMQQSRLVWLELAAFLVLAVLLVPKLDLLGLAVGRLGATTISGVAVALSARRNCGFGLRRWLAALARPLTGAVLMGTLMHSVSLQFAAPSAQVASSLSAGALFYVVWSFGTWHLVGRPQGVESTIVDAVAGWRRRRV